jgi:hypothetical protein
MRQIGALKEGISLILSFGLGDNFIFRGRQQSGMEFCTFRSLDAMWRPSTTLGFE